MSAFVRWGGDGWDVDAQARAFCGLSFFATPLFIHVLSRLALHSLLTQSVRGEPINRKLITLVIWLTVAFSATVFTLRGPLRARGDYASDFAAPYVSARLWLFRQDPYNAGLFWETWHNAGAPTHDASGEHTYANPSSTHSVYPPPSVVALSPFALLPWPVAWKALIAISTALYLSSLLLLTRLISGSWNDPFKPAFLAFGLLFAPTLSALHTSNVTGLSASLLFFAVCLLLSPASKDGPDTSSAVGAVAMGEDGYSQTTVLSIALLLALSISIKPTLAPFTLLYLIAARLWKILFTTLATTACITAVFFVLRPNPQWLASLLGNINFLFTSGVANLAEQNLTRSDRIDLQLPIYTLTRSRSIASIVAAFVALALLALWLRWTNRSFIQHGTIDGNSTLLDLNLLSISTLLAIGLLPFYQRFYSAMILLLPVVWAIRNLAQPRSRWILAACCLFLANTSVLPRRLGIHLPSAGPLRIVMDSLLMSHLCWLLFALSLLLLNALRSNTGMSASHSGQVEFKNSIPGSEL